MPTTIGSTGKSGSPVIKISIAGVFGTGVEFEATVDTGFSGISSIRRWKLLSTFHCPRNG
jgi:hypothetical protein